MGILNVTPDSFSDGGNYVNPELALAHALHMQAEGAQWIDVGGESTRPYASHVTFSEEIERVVPVIKLLAQHLSIPISIDTYKPKVMELAIEAGASMINDVYALRIPGALEVAKAAQVPVCLMHMDKNPGEMQDNPFYEDVTQSVLDFLKMRVEACLETGILAENLILDPGWGFGKTPAHNFQLLREIPKLKKLGFPLLAGLSRKAMIGATLGLGPTERLTPSVALATFAVVQGVNIIRTHDVLPTVQAVRMIEAVMSKTQ